MQDTPQNSSDKPVNDEKPLVSKGIYAAGHSFKDGVIWGLVATIAAYAVLALGRKPGLGGKPGNLIDVVAGFIEQQHSRIKGWLADGVKTVAKTVFNKDIDPKHASGSAITATAFLVGGLVAHIAQVPAAVRGWREAGVANAQYDKLKAERNELSRTNAELVEANAGLIVENNQYKSTPEKKGTSAEAGKDAMPTPVIAAESDVAQSGKFSRSVPPPATSHSERVASRDEATQPSIAM